MHYFSKNVYVIYNSSRAFYHDIRNELKMRDLNGLYTIVNSCYITVVTPN